MSGSYPLTEDEFLSYVITALEDEHRLAQGITPPVPLLALPEPSSRADDNAVTEYLGAREKLDAQLKKAKLNAGWGSQLGSQSSQQLARAFCAVQGTRQENDLLMDEIFALEKMVKDAERDLQEKSTLLKTLHQLQH